jgi:NADH-quinone oxidoreductase subunit N
MVLAILSIAIGSIVALMQTNIKRLLAYSTISHVLLT